MDRPEPTPLPGDLRVSHLVGPDVSVPLTGRWELQIYDVNTGSWRPMVGRDLRRRPAYRRVEPTFATEAAALEHLLAIVRGASG
jgi:hypothetical protein